MLLKLLLTTLVCVGLAFLENKQIADGPLGERKRFRIPWCLILIMVFFTFYSGLRTYYNDTSHYISYFLDAEPLNKFLADSENLDALHNPLYYLFNSAFRQLTDNSSLFLLACAALSVCPMLYFIRKTTAKQDFPMALYLFVAFGTYVFTLAAVKQSIAMGILCIAVLALEKKKYLPFFLLVVVAALVHTYAILFVILPFFCGKPWRLRSFLLLTAILIAMLTFESTIATFLEYADRIGKTVSESELFDGHRMNSIRVAVYGIVPLVTLIYRERLDPYMERIHRILINMSIFSFVFMLPGTITGGNLFGRVSTYFEISNVCILPWLIDTLFNERSAYLLKRIAVVAFLLFFLYDMRNFDSLFYAMDLRGFLQTLK
jgi:hypothetical protein